MEGPAARQNRLPWEEGSSLGREVYAPLQISLLLRLGSLLQKQRRYAANGKNAGKRRLLNRAIYAAYGDCIDEGVQMEAKILLRRWQRDVGRMADVESTGKEGRRSGSGG